MGALPLGTHAVGPWGLGGRSRCGTLGLQVGAAFKEYRLLHAAAARAPGALVFPQTLRYLPLFTLGLLKGTAFR